MASSPDCNGNAVPDECDLSSGLSLDGNMNSVPDECEVDCNNNGSNDALDILMGAPDIDGNGIPDECEAIQVGYGFCVSGPCGNDYAAAGCLNSTGVGASIVASGTSSVAADDLFVTMTGLPAFEFGLFYNGPGAVSGFAFGDGLRNVVGSVNRFPIQNSGSGGAISFGPVVGHANASFPVGGQISAGATWHFQGWFRDPAGACGSSFNLTHGLSLTFTP
jgi:hypothetical protein